MTNEKMFDEIGCPEELKNVNPKLKDIKCLYRNKLVL